MKNIISVLEKMGRLEEVTADELNSLDIEVLTAINLNDTSTLERLLDVKKDIVCMIAPAEDDEPSEGEEKPEDKEKIHNTRAL